MKMRSLVGAVLAGLVSFPCLAQAGSSQGAGAPLKVAIVGLVHGHVGGWFQGVQGHPEIQLVGVAEPDAALRERYASRYHLAPDTLFSSEKEMLQHVHPQAVLVYTSIADHKKVIEEAAQAGIGSMVEKPLATNYQDALEIERISKAKNVPVLVNYETTWYASNTEAAKMLFDGKLGQLRKLVVHDGHEGPKEIGVGPEFAGFLTDPIGNGAGALYDFGCYGVDLATYLMHGEEPVSVTAITLQLKPDVYPKVDDESVILLKYKTADAVIQGSWNWPFARKDMEVYGAKGYVDTVALNGLRIRLPGEKEEHAETATPLQSPQDTPLHYFSAVLRGEITPKGDLNSLDTNVTVMKILDAARESAKTGRTVMMAGYKGVAVAPGDKP